MIEFKKDVFANEKKKLQKFANEKLVTKEEKDNRVEMDTDFMGSSNVLDIDSVINTGDAFQLNGLDGNMGSDDLFTSNNMDDLFSNDFGNNRSVEYDVSQDNTHRTGVWWKDFFYSPFFLIFYVGKKLVYDPPNKADFISILKSLNTITIFTAVSSAFFWIIGLKFIFNLGFQTLASTLMFVVSFSLLKFVFKEDVTLPFLNKNKNEETNSTDFNLDDFTTGLDIDDDSPNMSDGSLISLEDIEDADVDFADDSEDDSYDIDSKGHYILPQSPIDISTRESFNKTLLEVFKENAKYQGVEIQDRLKLVDSFAKYIITNDKNFGKWREINPRTKEGTNMLYALYKGLGQIQNQFLKDDEEMVAIVIKENPLLYKIELELPNYFKEKQVKSTLFEIENMLRRDESDLNVSVRVSYIKGIWIFKLLRLDNTNLISMGDIFRFYDEEKGKTALDDFSNPKLGMPMLVGLQANEYPFVIDFEENTSGAIVGGSGSGKSWLTFALMFNFILANDYNNTQFVILDKKNASFWRAFAKFPHVLGHHTEPKEYLNIIKEAYGELQRRKQLLIDLGAEDIKGLRKMYREEGEFEKLKEIPLFTVVIDEITSTMTGLKAYYESQDQKATFDELRTIMSNITEEGRALGVRLLVIGQRSVDASIPKNVMMNSSLKFGMKMENSTEFENMFGKEVSAVKKPEGKGMGLLRSMDTSGFNMLRTLTLGGKDNEQILTLIRVLALEWIRRSIGQDDIFNPPKGMNLPLIYNRDKFVKESLKELEEGRILRADKISEDAKLDMTKITGKKTLEDIKPKKMENPFTATREKKTTIASGMGIEDIAEIPDFEEEDNEEIDIFSKSDGLDIFNSKLDTAEDLLANIDSDVQLNTQNNSDNSSIDSIIEKTEVNEEEYTPPSLINSVKSLFNKNKTNKEEKEEKTSEITYEESPDFLDTNDNDFNGLNNPFEINDDLDFENNVIENNEFEDEEIEDDEEIIDFASLLENSFDNKEDIQENSENFESEQEDELEDNTPKMYNSDLNSINYNDSKDAIEDIDLDELLKDDMNNEIEEEAMNIKNIFNSAKNHDIFINENENEVENGVPDFVPDFDSSVETEILDSEIIEDFSSEQEDLLNDLDFSIFFTEDNEPKNLEENMEIIKNENNDIFGTNSSDINDFTDIFNDEEDEEAVAEKNIFSVLMSNSSTKETKTKNPKVQKFKDSIQVVENENEEEITYLEDLLEETLNDIIMESASIDENLALKNTSKKLEISEEEQLEIEREREALKKIELREKERQKRLREEEERLKREREEFERMKKESEEQLRTKNEKINEAKKQAQLAIEEARKAQQIKNETKQKNTATGINLNFTSNVASEKPKMSIKKYIINYGEKYGLRSRRIPCDVLEEQYSKTKINESLDTAIIIKDGNFYITSI